MGMTQSRGPGATFKQKKERKIFNIYHEFECMVKFQVMNFSNQVFFHFIDFLISRNDEQFETSLLKNIWDIAITTEEITMVATFLKTFIIDKIFFGLW